MAVPSIKLIVLNPVIINIQHDENPNNIRGNHDAVSCLHSFKSRCQKLSIINLKSADRSLHSSLRCSCRVSLWPLTSSSEPWRNSGATIRRPRYHDCRPKGRAAEYYPDLLRSGLIERMEQGKRRDTPATVFRLHGLDDKSGFPVLRSMGTETCSWTINQVPLILR